MSTEVSTEEPKKIPTMSASRLDMYRSCKRKYAFKYVLKAPAPPNRFATAGSETHSQVEHWLLRKTLPNDLAAIELIRNLPPPDPTRYLIEQEFRFKAPHSGVNFVLKIDLYDPLSMGDTPRIYDHKSTTDLKWAKTPEQLEHDPQTLTYAYYDLSTNPHLSIVPMQWTWVTRAKPPQRSKSKKVSLALYRNEVYERFEAIDRVTVPEIVNLHLADNLDPNKDLQPTISHCKAYGGCPYLSICQVTTSQIMGATMSQMSLAEKIRARSAIQQSTGVPAQAPSHPVDNPIPSTQIPEVKQAATSVGVASQQLSRAELLRKQAEEAEEQEKLEAAQKAQAEAEERLATAKANQALVESQAVKTAVGARVVGKVAVPGAVDPLKVFAEELSEAFARIAKRI